MLSFATKHVSLGSGARATLAHIEAPQSTDGPVNGLRSPRGLTEAWTRAAQISSALGHATEGARDAGIGGGGGVTCALEATGAGRGGETLRGDEGHPATAAKTNGIQRARAGVILPSVVARRQSVTSACGRQVPCRCGSPRRS